MSGFHIHIDALEVAATFEHEVFDELGFWRSDFSGHPEGYEHYEPPHHLTQKVSTSVEFRELFDKVVEYARSPGAMKGYIEGEFVPLDRDLMAGTYDPSVSIPFRVHRTFLATGAFRETEVHITMDRDRSNRQLLQNLLDMGLYAAYLPKAYGTAVVFTAQGSRTMVDSILPSLSQYLERAGGAVQCSIKEERIADWWVSEPGLQLPPVIDRIEWDPQSPPPSSH